jgi:WD40 repeat protein
VKTGKLLHTLTGHSGSVISVAYSPDAQTLASGSWDTTIKLWDIRIRTGNPLQTFAADSDSVYLAYSPDGQTLASGSFDNTIKIWQVAASIPLSSQPASTGGNGCWGCLFWLCILGACFWGFWGLVGLASLFDWFYSPDDIPIELWKAEKRAVWRVTIFWLCLVSFFGISAFFLRFLAHPKLSHIIKYLRKINEL